MLKLAIDYAVCEKLCVPAEGKAELTLAGKPGAQDAWLKENDALLPQPAKVGAGDALSVRAVKRDGKMILVDVAAPAAVELFAEGPTAEWALPVPTPVSGAPAGQQRFSFALDGLPSGAKPEGVEIKLTAVSGTSAIEVPYRLD
jgi:DsbC/DsbD-like thiol-disulfide interchange protein